MRPSQMGTHTSDKGLFQKGLKKSLTKKRNTCPPTAKVFLERPTTQKGSKKSLHTQKGSKKSLRHWRPMRPSQTGTHTSDKALFQKGLKKNVWHLPPHCQGFFGTSHHTKRVQKKPSHTKRVQKKPSTLEAHEAKSNGNPYVWQGTIPERSEKKPDQKTEHLPPHCQGFFWNVPPHKNGPKKAFTYRKGPKKTFDTGGPWGQMGTHTSDKGLFQKGLKKNLTRKRNTCPHTAKVFFGTSHTQKGSKRSLRTQKGSKKSLRHWRPMRPSQMGTHTSDTCPHTAKVFLGRPTTQKGSKKSLRTQKVQKKPQVGTHTSDKGLSQKGLKKAWPEPTTRKGSKKSLRKQVGKKALTSKTNAYSHTGDTRAWVMVNHRKGSKKSPAGTEKNPARFWVVQHQQIAQLPNRQRNAPPVKLSAAPTVVSTRSAPWIGEDLSDSHELHQTRKHPTIPRSRLRVWLVADAVTKLLVVCSCQCSYPAGNDHIPYYPAWKKENHRLKSAGW